MLLLLLFSLPPDRPCSQWRLRGERQRHRWRHSVEQRTMQTVSGTSGALCKGHEKKKIIKKIRRPKSIRWLFSFSVCLFNACLFSCLETGRQTAWFLFVCFVFLFRDRQTDCFVFCFVLLVRDRQTDCFVFFFSCLETGRQTALFVCFPV